MPGVVAELSEICSSISSTLGYLCTALGPIAGNEGLTTGVCTALASLTLNPGTFALCDRTFTIIERACLVIGSPEVGIPSITDELCESVGELEEEFTPDFVRLSLHGYSNSGYVELPYGGPFEDISFGLPDTEAAIENLTINPVDPAPEQNYTATANIHCADGQQVAISIVGTDGYVDANSFIAQGGITIYLDVLGAYDGVQDIITIEVEDGPKMVTSIVF